MRLCAVYWMNVLCSVLCSLAEYMCLRDHHAQATLHNYCGMVTNEQHLVETVLVGCHLF